ncbi:MAG: hypothetical protein U0414_05305 [Polyangiaceae bacterium]
MGARSTNAGTKPSAPKNARPVVMSWDSARAFEEGTSSASHIDWRRSRACATERLSSGVSRASATWIEGMFAAAPFSTVRWPSGSNARIERTMSP